MLSLFTRQKPVDPPHLTVTHGEAVYHVNLRRSERATKLTLRMRTGGITLTAPPRAKLVDIVDFATRYSGWIDARVKKMPDSIPIIDGAIIPFKGKPLTIRHLPQTRGNTWLIGNELNVGGDPIGLKRRVMQFLMSEAKRDLLEASFRHAETLGVTITNITLRDTKTRWGSCSSLGSLNYSWRIILAPPEVLDYLCAHEVCHRLEMNHSARFWALVKRLYPDYKTQDAWLKKHGAKLHLVGS